MKVILSFLLCILVAENLGVSILPQLPDQILVDSITVTTSAGVDVTTIDVTETQFDTVLQGLSKLQDDLTYDCVSSNFQLALYLPSDFTANALYNADALVIVMGTYHKFENVVGAVTYPSTSTANFTLSGQIINYDCTPLVQEVKIAPSILTNVTITEGTHNGGSIIDDPHGGLPYFTRLVNDAVNLANKKIAETLMENYLNQLFANISFMELVEMTGGSCIGVVQ